MYCQWRDDWNHMPLTYCRFVCFFHSPLDTGLSFTYLHARQTSSASFFFLTVFPSCSMCTKSSPHTHIPFTDRKTMFRHLFSRALSKPTVEDTVPPVGFNTDGVEMRIYPSALLLLQHDMFGLYMIMEVPTYSGSARLSIQGWFYELANKTGSNTIITTGTKSSS